jgi:hypothetical protein
MANSAGCSSAHQNIPINAIMSAPSYPSTLLPPSHGSEYATPALRALLPLVLPAGAGAPLAPRHGAVSPPPPWGERSGPERSGPERSGLLHGAVGTAGLGAAAAAGGGGGRGESDGEDDVPPPGGEHSGPEPVLQRASTPRHLLPEPFPRLGHGNHHMPMFPYHELNQSTLHDLLTHINAMHEDIDEIVRAYDSWTWRLIQNYADSANNAAAINTEYLFDILKAIRRMLYHDFLDQEAGIRSGAHHLIFLKPVDRQRLMESKDRIVAVLRLRADVREGALAEYQDPAFGTVGPRSEGEFDEV